MEADSLRDKSNSQRVRGAVGGLQLLLRHWFIPEDVTPDYYHFTFWRMFQRFVAGTINVFGTQVGGWVWGVGIVSGVFSPRLDLRPAQEAVERCWYI